MQEITFFYGNAYYKAPYKVNPPKRVVLPNGMIILLSYFCGGHIEVKYVADGLCGDTAKETARKLGFRLAIQI